MPASVRALLLLGVTLAAGVALGVSYERRRGMTHEMAGGHAEHMIQQITRELDLDSIQRDTVAKIFARRQSAIDSARDRRRSETGTAREVPANGRGAARGSRALMFDGVTSQSSRV